VAVRLLEQTSKGVHLVAQELAAVVKIRRTAKPFAADFVCIDGEELSMPKRAETEPPGQRTSC